MGGGASSGADESALHMARGNAGSTGSSAKTGTGGDSNCVLCAPSSHFVSPPFFSLCLILLTAGNGAIGNPHPSP